LLTVGVEGHQLLIDRDKLCLALAGVMFVPNLRKFGIDFPTFLEFVQFPKVIKVERLKYSDSDKIKLTKD
jgi:hypothetical protein